MLYLSIFFVNFKENLPNGKSLGEDRDLVGFMGIRIFINFDPIK